MYVLMLMPEGACVHQRESTLQVGPGRTTILLPHFSSPSGSWVCAHMYLAYFLSPQSQDLNHGCHMGSSCLCRRLSHCAVGPVPITFDRPIIPFFQESILIVFMDPVRSLSTLRASFSMSVNKWQMMSR